MNEAELIKEIAHEKYRDRMVNITMSRGQGHNGKSYAAMAFAKYFENYLEEEQWRVGSVSSIGVKKCL